MKPVFNGDRYDTPENRPRWLLDRLALNTRWVFVANAVWIINHARVLANQGRYNDEEWVKSSVAFLKLIEGCGGRFHLEGLKNIALTPEPVVFVSNHMSTLETFVFPCLIVPQKKVTYAVKESLVKASFFGPVMRSRDPIIVGRSNPREDFKIVMEKGQELLAKGVSVVIFPQSTRMQNFQPEEFNSLGIKLAKAAGVKACPVAIKTDFWGNGKLLKDFGPLNRFSPVHMTFGEPFTVIGSGKEEHQRTVDFIQENLKKWEQR